MAGRQDTKWCGLEVVEGLATTQEHWRVACGPGVFALIRTALEPTGESADWWPDPSDPLRTMRVIVDPANPGGLLAVSEDEPRTEGVKPTPAEVAVFKLNLARFGQALARVMGFAATRSAQPLSASVVRIGSIPSHGIEVFLAIPCHEGDLFQALELIRARCRGEFALVTPTSAGIAPSIRAAIDNGVFQHATLGELVAVGSDGALSLLWSPSECFSPAAGVQTGPPYETWPLERPPLANWGHVTIMLSEPDVLRIEFGRSSREFTSRDIVGFTKRSPGQHMTEAWGLLRRLADNGGTLPTDAGETAQRNLRATRKSLADLLKRFFGINSLPFAENRRAKVWAANFGIRRRD